MSRAGLRVAAAGARSRRAPAAVLALRSMRKMSKARSARRWRIVPGWIAAAMSLRSGRSPSKRSKWLFHKTREFAHNALVDCPFERHDQIRHVLHRFPAPRGEFRFMAAGGIGEVDLALRAGEAQRKPFLFLAAIFAFPRLADDFARDVVAEPFVDLGEPLDRPDIGLFVQFAQRRRPWLFARVNTALWHLPGMGGVRSEE